MRSKELIRGVLYINSSLVVQKNHTEQVRFSNQAPRPSKALGSLREDPFQRSLISYSAHAGHSWVWSILSDGKFMRN